MSIIARVELLVSLLTLQCFQISLTFRMPSVWGFVVRIFAIKAFNQQLNSEQFFTNGSRTKTRVLAVKTKGLFTCPTKTFKKTK